MSLRYNVKENEPAGWPDSISFEDFKGVSYAKVEEATQIIESLIRYHAKVDPETYFESRRETNEDDAVVDTSEDETEVLGNQELDQLVENGNNEEIDQPEQIHPPNNYMTITRLFYTNMFFTISYVCTFLHIYNTFYLSR